MLNLIKKLKLNRRQALIITLVCVALVGAAVSIYIVKINRRIAEEREQQAAAARVDVEQTRLRPPATSGYTIYLNAADVRATAVLAGTRYLATSGGLITVDEGGSVKRRYTTLDGLTDNDLTALAVFRERLFIGTAGAGLMSFDGDTFTGYRFVKPKATRVSVLATNEGELLIGTLDGGLFEFNGDRFSRRFNNTAGADFSRVTSLLPYESRLYIGTQDQGLYLWREAHIEHFTMNESLPSPHVTAMVALPGGLSSVGEVAVATDYSVVVMTAGGEIKPLATQANVISLAVSGGRLWAGLFTGGAVIIGGPEGKATGKLEPPSSHADVVGLPRTAPVIVQTDAGKFWALTREGAFVRDERAPGPAFDAVAASLVSERVLTGDHITSLALDNQRHLWVGYFDRGIDLIAPETSERLSHIADDRVREINFIAFDPNQEQILAATSRGLAIFDGRMKQSVLTREQNGLVSDAIAHISIADVDAPIAQSASGAASLRLAQNHTLVLATAGGLTEITGGRARSVTAFHGLASNHLYTSASVGSRLFVGSLAGLVELEGLRVVRTYKTSNSQLSHDWVTGLAESDGTLYVGTNGGGVDALLPTGEWISFADDREVGKFEVNQNAMHVDGERLYVGTSDKGLLVYNTRDRRWSRLSAGLPSPSVTAIATDERYVYVGTMNGLVRIEKRVLN